MTGTKSEQFIKRQFETPIVDLQYLELFTLPIVAQDEEQKLLAELNKDLPLKHNLGLVIGRFQPLHYGHIYLMKQALTVAQNIIIGIGSANVKNKDNPFPVEMREQMIRKALERERLTQNIISIVHINDYNNDLFWFQETLRKTGNVDIVIGNNEWVNGIFREQNYKTLEVPLLNRNTYEGKKIRQKLRDEGRLGD